MIPLTMVDELERRVLRDAYQMELGEDGWSETTLRRRLGVWQREQLHDG